MNVNRIVISPIIIQIAIPAVFIILEFIFPIIPLEMTQDIEHIIPAIFNASYPSYYIILILIPIQTLLVFKYLLYVPMKEYLKLSYSPKGFLNAYTHPFSYYSQYYSYYSPKRYFKSGGYEKPVIKYEYTKKVLYAEILLFIVLIIIYYAGYYYICPFVLLNNQNCMFPAHLKNEFSNSTLTKELLENFIVFLHKIILMDFTLIIAIYPVLFAVSLLSIRKEFRFYFAHACMKVITDEVISEKKDVIEKTNYLIRGLNSYNIYLRRSIGFQIRDLKGLYSTIISHSPIEKKGLIDFLSSAFEDDNDKLKAVRYLSVLEKDEKRFLVKESLIGKIETWGKFAVAIIPIVISVIEILLGKSK